jgi:type I restriction enzyme S subunit
VLGFQRKYPAAAVRPAYDIWEATGHHEFDRQYLERILCSPHSRSIYQSKMRGTTNRRRTIPKDVFKLIEFPLPPLAEQKRIAGILDAADALQAKRRESFTQLDTLFASLQSRAFNGEL